MFHNGILRSSRNNVGIGSRLIADITAGFYDKYLPQYATGKLLDLGCGMAPFQFIYNNYVTQAVLLDWKNSKSDNTPLDYVCDLTKSLPFSDNEYDTIILSDVLEHIPNPMNLWLEMSRVLKAEGILILNVPFFHYLHEIPHDYYRYTEYALRYFATSAGLEVLVLEEIGGLPEVLADLHIRYARRYGQYIQIFGRKLSIPFLGKKLPYFVYYIAKFLLGTAVMRKISNNSKKDFPYAYFMVARNSPNKKEKIHHENIL